MDLSRTEQYLLEILFIEGEDLTAIMLENLTAYTRRHVRRTLAKLKFKRLINESRQRFNGKDFVGTKVYHITNWGSDLLQFYKTNQKAILLSEPHKFIERALANYQHELLQYSTTYLGLI